MINKLIALYQLLSNAVVLLFSNQINKKKLLKHHFENSIIYFDVGANLGSNVKFIKKLYREQSEIHCFEPNKKCFKILKSIKGIIANNVAIDNTNSSKNFYEHKISSWSSLKKIKGFNEKYKVNCQTLDRYILKNKIKKIDNLKIDTEGNDFNVLLSARKSIKLKKIKLIEVEIIFSEKNNFTNKHFDSIYGFLKKNNYLLIGINDQKIKRNRILGLNAIFCIK